MEIWFALLIAVLSIAAGSLSTWFIGIKLGKIQQAEWLKKLREAVLDREHVSLNEEFLMTEYLAEKLSKANFKPDIIFAICPGGAMIAEWLSRRFFGNRSTPIPIQLLYMTPQKGGMVTNDHLVEVNDIYTTIPSDLSKESKVLLVNDVSRGGHTLHAATDYLKKYFQEENILSAALICYHDADVKPRHYVAMTKKTIRFDWKSYDKIEQSSSNLE